MSDDNKDPETPKEALVAPEPRKKYSWRRKTDPNYAPGISRHGRRSMITPEIEEEIMELAIADTPITDITKKILEKHGIELHANRIRQVLLAVREERSLVAKAVSRAELAKYVTSDLRRLNKLMIQAEELADDAYAKSEKKQFVLLAEAVRKMVGTRLHFLGIDMSDETDVKKLSDEDFTALKQALLAQLSSTPPTIQVVEVPAPPEEEPK